MLAWIFALIAESIIVIFLTEVRGIEVTTVEEILLVLLGYLVITQRREE